jgi:hypothetical protein
MCELTQLEQLIEQAQQGHFDKDVWGGGGYIWGNNQYSSSRYYTLNLKNIQAPKPFKWIWKANVTKELKIFIWLVFRDRINSRNLLRRKNFSIEGDDYTYVLCNLGIEEFTYHLIFQCPFCERCWNSLVSTGIMSFTALTLLRKLKKIGRMGILEVFSIAVWEIWKR